MAQIDKLNFVPLLFWFLIFFVFFYFYLVIYVLPFIFGALRVRALFFNYLVNELLDWVFFRGFFVFVCSNTSHFSVINFLLTLLVSLFYLDYFFFFFNGFLSAPGAASLEDF